MLPDRRDEQSPLDSKGVAKDKAARIEERKL
jgi:hypothetical protein